MSSRRDFLRNGAFAAAALSLPVKNLMAHPPAPYKPLGNFGIQLWTVKEDMAANAKDTLKKLSEAGYKQIESFEGKQGIFWGWKNTEFRKYMDDLGMAIVSSHCNISDGFEKKAAEAAAIGMKYLICPFKGPQKSIDDFKRFADEFNKAGEICKKNGIRFAYHNHDYSFKAIDGQIPQEVMMKGTDKNLVDFEMDIYWVVAAGENPQAWFDKHPGRFKLCHVKDLAKTAKGHESVHLGKGSIDFKSILKAGTAKGLNYYIVEQESFTGTNPLESAAVDAKYMQQFNM